jgi:hypothetical protein
MVDPNPDPKVDPHAGSNTEQPPEGLFSGDEPMTGAQASYLATLCELAKIDRPAGAFTKAQAAKLIDELKARILGR